jgi:transcriptional regulator with XRE-family HTH domain
MLQSLVRKPGPAPVDLHVGRRLRQARMTAGLSQQKIADALGLTFQQVQKYEKGTNRVAPSRLTVIAQPVGRDIAWFFADAPGTPKSAGPVRDDSIDHLSTSREGLRLANAFVAIRSRRLRAAIVDLAESAVAL